MNIGKRSIIPTNHYLMYHSDVEWDLIILAVLSPTKILSDKRYGKENVTYIKNTKKFIIKVHAKIDNVNQVILIINAFKEENEMSQL